MLFAIKTRKHSVFSGTVVKYRSAIRTFAGGGAQALDLLHMLDGLSVKRIVLSSALQIVQLYLEGLCDLYGRQSNLRFVMKIV